MDSNERQQKTSVNTYKEHSQNKNEEKTGPNHSAQKDGFRYDYDDASDV